MEVHNYKGNYSAVFEHYNNLDPQIPKLLTDGELTYNSTNTETTINELKGTAYSNGHLNLKYSSNFIILWYNGSVMYDIRETLEDAEDFYDEISSKWTKCIINKGQKIKDDGKDDEIKKLVGVFC